MRSDYNKAFSVHDGCVDTGGGERAQPGGAAQGRHPGDVERALRQLEGRRHAVVTATCRLQLGDDSVWSCNESDMYKGGVMLMDGTISDTERR